MSIPLNPFLLRLIIGCSALLSSAGVFAQVSELPRDPIYLWSENALISPDREAIQNQRVYGIDNPSMTPFWPDPKIANGTSVVIFPGGGYVRLAIDHEGYDVARWFNERGVAAFVVKYRMQEYGFPAPLLDGLRAVRLVRSNAEAWQLDKQKIGIVGFSAGGHLAAGVATRYQFTSPLQEARDPMRDVSARPDFAILGYPVITLEGADAHEGSRKALLGENPDALVVREGSFQHHVHAQVPPIFMVHGIGDKAVSVSNSLMFFSEVQKHNQASELHVYQTAVHGFGLGQAEGEAGTTVSSWPQALELWLRQNKFL